MLTTYEIYKIKTNEPIIAIPILALAVPEYERLSQELYENNSAYSEVMSLDQFLSDSKVGLWIRAVPILDEDEIEEDDTEEDVEYEDDSLEDILKQTLKLLEGYVYTNDTSDDDVIEFLERADVAKYREGCV